MRRDIIFLLPVVREKCKALANLCDERGINIIVTSTLRTEAEQAAYFAQGRRSLAEVNRLRKAAGLMPVTEQQNRVITWVKTSVHQFGCAFDIAIVKDRRAVWDVKADVNENEIADYEEVGRMGEQLGLTWGGRFKGRDMVHFQDTGGLSLKDLIAGEKPFEIRRD